MAKAARLGTMTAAPEIKAHAATQSNGLSPALLIVRSMRPAPMSPAAGAPRTPLMGSVRIGTPPVTSQRGLSRVGKQHPFCGSVEILILAGPH